MVYNLKIFTSAGSEVTFPIESELQPEDLNLKIQLLLTNETDSVPFFSIGNFCYLKSHIHGVAIELGS